MSLRLEVDLFVSHLVDVDHLREDTLLDKRHTSIVATVEIQRTYERLKGIATEITVMGIGASARQDKITDSHLFGQFVERLALHELRARVGEESLTLAGEMTDRRYRLRQQSSMASPKNSNRSLLMGLPFLLRCMTLLCISAVL
jgi:hypothetical protein